MRARFTASLLALVICRMANAHPMLQNALWAQVETGRVHIAVEVSLREIMVAQNAALGPFAGEDAKVLNAAADRHRDYVLKHLFICAGTNMLAGQVIGLTPPPELDEAENTYYQYELEYPLTGLPPAELTFYHTMLKEWPYAAGTAWRVNYVLRMKSRDTDLVNAWLLPSQQQVSVATGWPAISADRNPSLANGSWRKSGDYVCHGIRHILTGYDHLLFIAALVLATRNFMEMFKVIAAFTLAHTLTLALSVFDIVRLPAFIVEPVIALSIVFVAVENVFWPSRAHSPARLAVAFGFGLIHGLGFAGGLLDAMAGLPAIGIWIALGAFSLGVEIGHQAIVLPWFGLLKLSRHKWNTGGLVIWLRYGSGAIAICGAYYLMVAMHEQFFAR
ncbi:MAG: HupE/UreJ family protein [Verrucomicrobiota bacterium]